MDNNQKSIPFSHFVLILFMIWLLPFMNLSAQDLTIGVHLRGVYESKISLLALTPSATYNSVAEVQSVKNGEFVSIQVPNDKLPGEFILRFDYKETGVSSPYPSEMNIIVNNQNLELWVSPKFCTNPDSTWFQKGERENTSNRLFTKENAKQKEKIGVLQQFLMSYDDTKSKFYQMGTEEYEQRSKAYNQWLEARINSDKALFVSSTYRFQYIPPILWEGNETERLLSAINHYFDGMDFSDAGLIKTADLNSWMDNYVNLYGQMAVTTVLRDSLFSQAAKIAIEKTKNANPKVYGWMVDYFYRGFESNNIPAGMKTLEPYLNDTNCLTSKRMEISRRLKGMQTLIVNSKAPDINLKDAADNPFRLYDFNPSSPYILLLFWSADCSHCTETLSKLYPWQQQSDIQKKVSVVALSLDETDVEVQKWQQKKDDLKSWVHLRAAEGINSKAANDYFILATPVMILMDAKTKNIISMPDNINELMKSIK